MPEPRRGRCGAYSCQCAHPHAVKKTRDYDICACGHSTLSHAKGASS